MSTRQHVPFFPGTVITRRSPIKRLDAGAPHFPVWDVLSAPRGIAGRIDCIADRQCRCLVLDTLFVVLMVVVMAASVAGFVVTLRGTGQPARNLTPQTEPGPPPGCMPNPGPMGGLSC